VSGSGASSSRAGETGLTAASAIPSQPARPAPLDARVALAAHLAGLALTAGAIVGFAVLMVLSLHWLTGLGGRTMHFARYASRLKCAGLA